MINDKLITITKENTIDCGWSLFSPCNRIALKNDKYVRLSVSDIVKKITYADDILLVLKDTCLPSKIVDELVWVNKYIKIRLVAKEKYIVEHFSALQFSDVTINEQVCVDYLGIQGKDGKKSYLLDDGIIAIDDIVEKILLGEKVNERYAWADNADEVYVLEESGELNQKSLLEYCAEHKIKTSYCCSTKSFSKYIYDFLVDKPIDMLACERIKSGVLFLSGGRLFEVHNFMSVELSAEISDIYQYIQSSIFLNLKLKPILSGGEIPSKIYFIDGGSIRSAEIKNTLVIKDTVDCLTMKAFIDEEFDRSETEKHDLYCMQARYVEYRYVLRPPIIDGTYSYSAIYDEAKAIYKEWVANYNIDWQTLVNELNEFGTFESWTKFTETIQSADEYLAWLIESYEYGRYGQLINDYRQKFKTSKTNLIDKFLDLYGSIAERSSITQYSKLDEEIESYRSIVAEKRVLIEHGKEVLSNKRRIEVLEKKIEDLTLLRERFKIKSSGRIKDERNDFIQKYNDILFGIERKTAEVDIISDIVNVKEMTDYAKLNLFLAKWVKRIDEFLAHSIAILDKLAAIDVPEDYVVYDKNNKRYIVIESEQDYYVTQELCKKYKAECISRR